MCRNEFKFKSSNHAVERFYERVLDIDIKFEDMNKKQIEYGRKLINEALMNRPYYTGTYYLQLADYDGFYAVLDDDLVITIILQEEKDKGTIGFQESKDKVYVPDKIVRYPSGAKKRVIKKGFKTNE